MKRATYMRRIAFRNRNTWCTALLCATLACGGPACSKMAPPVDADVAFLHATVVPMDAPRLLSDQTVLVRGPRIVAVGPSVSTPVADRARVIDGSGKFLMPGLADMHVHINTEADLLLFVANGVTTVRNMWGSWQELAWQRAVANGTLLDGAPPIWDSSTVVRDAKEASEVVKAGRARGYEFVKVYERLSRPAYDGVVAEAARLGVPVAGHVPRDVGVEHVLDSHQASIEHLSGYFAAAQRDDSPVPHAKDRATQVRGADYLDDAKLAKLVKRTTQAGTWNCPTLVLGRRFVPLEEARELFARPEMRYVPPPILASWDPTKDFRIKMNTPEDFAAMRRGRSETNATNFPSREIATCSSAPSQSVNRLNVAPANGSRGDASCNRNHPRTAPAMTIPEAANHHANRLEMSLVVRPGCVRASVRSRAIDELPV